MFFIKYGVIFMKARLSIIAISILWTVGAFFVPAMASADTVQNIKIMNVGNQGTQLYALLEYRPQNCANNIVYHSSETQAGQYVMSILLSAKLSQRPISRMDYTVGAGGICWIDLIEI